MAALTRESLKKLRDSLKKDFNRINSAGKTKVVIGMGTCGLAAGAKETEEAFLEALAKEQRKDVVVSGTGCMGLCFAEPTVEVIVPGMPSVVYGNVDREMAERIVRKHIQGKILVNDHIYDKPSVDIIEELEGN
ncbi:MAG: (2Fe-2S) ferredoxin domain-containing protein [Spirochaetes bacterium]|nr:MAG: (2Fe-2S) ferredoxin domain-containing protein [Spirochaetota bacterium]